MLWGSKVNYSSRLQGIVFPTLVLLTAALLLLCQLDDMYLWQDEAETAIIARHLLAYGLPLSTNGTDWVQQAEQSFVEFTQDYVWIYHSWIQYALTALAFSVFGPTTFAARLPFVLTGLATLCFVYSFVLRWLGNRRTALVATILLLFCVPFILLLRQCRYYAVAAFSTLLTLDAYLRFPSQRQWVFPYFVLSAVLLYHSHYGAFFPTVTALALYSLLRMERRVLYRFLASLLLVAVLVLPWASFMRVWNRGQPFQFDRFLAHIGQYFLYITGWVFPKLLALFLFIAWARRSKRTGLALDPGQAAFCELAVLVISLNFLFLSASAAFDHVFFRYVAHLIPLLLSMLAIIVVCIMERLPTLAYALLIILVLSNGLHVFPYGLPGVKQLDWSGLWPRSPAFQAVEEVWLKAGRFRSDVWMYAQELTHSYEGPNEGLLSYLSAHAQPGQIVVVNYEDLPLMFYTKLRVLGGLSGHGLTENLQPDWVIDRKHGPYRDRLAAIVTAGSYERIEIPYPDIRWENRPEPGVHHYRTVQDEDHVVLYKKQRD